MYKAFIFDLDGTVSDTIETIAYYGNFALNKYGFEPIEANEYKYLAGDGANVLVRRMLARYGEFSEDFILEFLNFYMTEYEKDSLYLTKQFEGLNDVLKELRERGIKTGVVSNKPNGAVCDVVENLFAEGTFDSYMGISDGVLTKPNPDSVLKTAAGFGVEPIECVYVGDTNVDMKTGKNAGMYTVGVLWGFRDYDELKENGADLIIKKPDELLELV